MNDPFILQNDAGEIINTPVLPIIGKPASIYRSGNGVDVNDVQAVYDYRERLVALGPAAKTASAQVLYAEATDWLRRNLRAAPEHITWDDVERNLPDPPGFGTLRDEFYHGPNNHDDIVRWVVHQPRVMDYMYADKKIQAIKELRTLASIGLKEAKDVVEDGRVLSAVAARR